MTVRTVDLLHEVLLEAGYSASTRYSPGDSERIIYLLGGRSESWSSGRAVNVVLDYDGTVSLIIPPTPVLAYKEALRRHGIVVEDMNPGDHNAYTSLILPAEIG